MDIENQQDKLNVIKSFVYKISLFAMNLQKFCIIQLFIAGFIKNKVYRNIMFVLFIWFTGICTGTLFIANKIIEIQRELI
jgi:hypothetical protein